MAYLPNKGKISVTSTSNQEEATSFPCSPPRCIYDVFLSFRGKDTRKNFTGHLYSALKQRGINAYLDDRELERGSSIEPTLWKAIEESRFSIIVFSKNYASSSWCLDELVKIVQCKEEKGHIPFPVFYDVDPCEVAGQTKNYGKAFVKYNRDFRENPEKVRRWKDSLTKIANLAGWDIRNSNESEIIRVIIEDISHKISCTISRTSKGLVGIEPRMKQLNGFLDEASNDTHFIGIFGMGGLGKTTLAREVYERIHSKFEGVCFLANVREVYVKHGAVPLQEQLLSETLMQEIRLRDDYKGISEIQHRLRYKKVLVILDDVNKREQLEKLAAEHRWFGPGSRIIITSRDKHVLTAHGVSRIYEAEKLNDDEALILFSSKAFKRDQPMENYGALSKRVVSYAHGLPLALEVIGSFLHGRSIDEWNSAINRLKENLDRDILDVLQISFDGLNELEKNIFLDISCFFKGMKKDRVTKILDHCGFHASIGIQVLVEKSLIHVSQNELWMHDLLQIMGKEIVRRESSENPGGRSRLWGYKDVFHALMNTTGRLESIYLDLPKTEQADWNMDGFLKLSKLRLLKIRNLQLFQGPEYLSNELRFLEWHAFPSKSLPVSFQPDELVELDMSYSSIEQLWHGSKSLVNLKIINLSHSLNLTNTLDFTGTPNLERLILEGCKSLFDVHPSISFHKKLEYVNLVDCESLRSLPSNFEMESLKICALNGCSRLEKFPDIIGNMNGLEKLCLDATAIKELPSSIQYLSGLMLLSMNDCKSLERLPSSLSGLKSLQKFDLSCCSRLQNLPEDLGDVECLKELDASGTAIRNVPVSIFLLKNLKVLSFDGCKRIDLALASLSCLYSLTELNLSDCNMTEGVLPENLGCCLSTLRNLDLSRNSFITLPNSINNLSRLEALALEDCMMLQSLPKLPSNIQIVNLNGCSLLAEIPDLINLKHLKLLELKCLNCWKLYECNGGDEMVMDMLDKYLQGIHIGLRRPGFSIVVPGTTIPGKFWYNREGSFIDVELPPKVKGIVACVAFGPCEFSSSLDNCGGGYLSCHMKINGREDFPSSILINWNFIQVLSDHLWLFYLSFEHVEGWQYNCHNNIELSFCACERMKVTNCAILLVCGMEQGELSLSAQAPSMACTPLRQLEKGKSDWQIRIRVLHTWEGVSSLTHELRSLNLIVIDEEHTLCQCTIDENLAWRFRPWLHEGFVYVVRNLSVDSATYNGPVSGDLKLTFLPITYIFDVNDNDSLIPKHHFEFADYDLLMKRARDDDTSTGLDSRYGSRDGKSLSSCSSKLSLFSEPQTPRSEGETLQLPILKTFTFRELKTATRNFRPDRMLGEGGFGWVFKGWVDKHSLKASRPGAGMVIAVKRLKQEGFQGHREWLAEINYLGRFQHPNLIKLIGYCLKDDHRLLVYEFMPRGSMENHLFRRGSHSQPLSWNLRMKVALDAARGLAFLHSAEANVIYRGFKTSEILLDSNYNAKLSDFGLAVDGPTGDESHVCTAVMGTYGYAAPEYVATGYLTTKCDVYSFGVVLLEMLSGQRVCDKNRPSGQHYLVEWTKPYLANERRVLRVLDARLEGQYVLSQVRKVASLVIQCLAVEPKFRPSMDEVVTVLEQLQEVKKAQ